VTFAISASGATLCTLSSKPRLFSGPNPRHVKCRGKQTLTFPAAAVGLHWTFKFTARNARGQVSRATRKLVLGKPPFAVSGNWAGYAIGSNIPVTKISGQFTVPRLDCRDTTDASEAMWVGIGGDGASSGDLLQTGVVSTCSGGRQVENPAWWEEYPENLITRFQGISVSPGDQIAASVYQASDGSWSTRLDDLTTGISGLMHTGDAWGTVSDSNPTTWLQREGGASTVSYNGGSSAEWIIEDYGLSNGAQVPFADFGTVAFTNLATSIPSWSLTPGEAIGLGDQNGLLLAAPSAPSGTGFSVTYTG
jgi:hypothetical protein